MCTHLFPDHGIIFVVGVIGITQSTYKELEFLFKYLTVTSNTLHTVWTKFKFQELVSKLALVTNIVSYIEISHGAAILES